MIERDVPDPGAGQSVRVPDGPIYERTARAAARNSQFLWVYISTLDDFINAGHKITKVISGKVILDYVSELLARPERSARIDRCL